METSSLFRQPAVESRANTLIGDSPIVGPPAFKVFALTALGAAVAFVGIILFGTYSKKATVTGYVTTTEANIRVFPNAAGVISDLYVAEGDEVEKGQALARISSAVSTSLDSFQTVQAELLVSMNNEAESLRKQIARSRELAGSEEIAIQQKIDSALFQIGAIKEQIADTKERLALAEKNSVRIERLRSQGLVSEADVDAARTRFLDAKLKLNELKRELGMLRAELGQRRVDLEQSPAISTNQIADRESSLARIEQRIAETERQDATIITAPVAGKISDLGRRVGQQIGANIPVVSLLPVSTDYNAELYVPSRSIGFVREGSQIRIRYDAYPYQKYGMFPGEVLKVSTTPIRPGEANAPIAVPEPSYLLVVSLEDNEVAANGEVLRIQAGMTLKADLVRDERRIIQWLFDPLASVVERAR